MAGWTITDWDGAPAQDWARLASVNDFEIAVNERHAILESKRAVFENTYLTVSNVGDDVQGYLRLGLGVGGAGWHNIQTWIETYAGYWLRAYDDGVKRAAGHWHITPKWPHVRNPLNDRYGSDDYTVTGTGDPSPNGVYTYDAASSPYNDWSVYKRADGAYYLWLDPDPSGVDWIISTNPGTKSPGYWKGGYLTSFTFVAQGTYTGDAYATVKPALADLMTRMGLATTHFRRTADSFTITDTGTESLATYARRMQRPFPPGNVVNYGAFDTYNGQPIYDRENPGDILTVTGDGVPDIGGTYLLVPNITPAYGKSIYKCGNNYIWWDGLNWILSANYLYSKNPGYWKGGLTFPGGAYTPYGTYTGNPHVNYTYCLWYNSATGEWVLSTAEGTTTPGCWTRAGTVRGDYSAQGTYTGTPNVADTPPLADWTDPDDPAWLTPGLIRVGDIIGPWIFEDLQACLNGLIWMSYNNHAAYPYGSYNYVVREVDSTWAAAEAACEANWPEETGSPGSYVEVRKSHYASWPARAAIMREHICQYVTPWPYLVSTKKDIDWYVFLEAAGTWDDHGDGVVEDRWHKWLTDTDVVTGGQVRSTQMYKPERLDIIPDGPWPAPGYGEVGYRSINGGVMAVVRYDSGLSCY